MKTIEIKEIPCLRYYDYGDDDENPAAHYTISIMKGIIGEVISNPDYDDGTLNCTGSDEYAFILSEDISDSDIKEHYENRQPDWTKVKTIHFDESCTVPRYKLGTFCSQKGIKVVRSREKADTILYGPSFKQSIFSDDCSDFITKENLFKASKKLKQTRIPQMILDSIENHPSSIIIVQDCEWLIPKKKHIRGCFKLLENERTWKELTETQRYCNQEVLLQDMGLEVMDEFTFRRVCQMFDSEDSENHRVAMEIMSNCNYRNSIVYLLELMRRYYGDKMFNTNDRGHVSFKALRIYLHYEPRNNERSFNNIISNVAERALLTESNYKIILKLILEEEEKSMGVQEDGDCDRDNWRVVQADLSPKYKAMVIWDKKEEEVPVLEDPQPDFTS